MSLFTRQKMHYAAMTNGDDDFLVLWLHSGGFADFLETDLAAVTKRVRLTIEKDVHYSSFVMVSIIGSSPFLGFFMPRRESSKMASGLMRSIP